jgi:hypothetical protein
LKNGELSGDKLSGDKLPLSRPPVVRQLPDGVDAERVGRAVEAAPGFDFIKLHFGRKRFGYIFLIYFYL